MTLLSKRLKPHAEGAESQWRLSPKACYAMVQNKDERYRNTDLPQDETLLAERMS
jgi:hypothetical protein